MLLLEKAAMHWITVVDSFKSLAQHTTKIGGVEGAHKDFEFCLSFDLLDRCHCQYFPY